MQEPQEYIVDINEQNAQQYLIDESAKRLVVVDFWADWCGPCKSLMPILEKLAQEYSGEWLLAKINADEQQNLCSQFGVQSLPTVALMKNGQPIDGFAGVLTEVEIRAMLDKHLPKPWDTLLIKGRELLQQGATGEALPVLKEAYTSSNFRADIAFVLTEAYLQLKRLDEAGEVLAAVKMVDQDNQFEQLKAQLELAKNASKAPEIDALEKALQAQPDDAHIMFQLAVQYSQHAYHREALALLVSILSKDLNARDGEVRQVFNDVIAVLGKGDPLAVEFQRKIYALLY